MILSGQPASKLFNPLSITEAVHKKYLQFVQTSFAPNNPKLKRKLEQLVDKGFLWREPYISISHRYKKGRPFRNFVEIHNMNPLLLDSFRSENLYLHQEKSIANILSGKNTVVASGTGSGKTEIFFIPMLNYCINNRSSGIKVIIVYPMNALANDQIDRLRDILFTINSKADKPITFAIYTGQTPENPQTKEFREMIGVPLTCPQCKEETLRVTSDGSRSFLKCDNSRISNHDVKIEYQMLTRDELRNNLPDILITNYVQLQYLMLRKQDENLFQGNKLRFLILDEIHAYGGARGIDVSLLIRRLRKRILDNGGDPIYIGTSATLSTFRSPEKRKEDIAEFAGKLFGVGIGGDQVFEGEKEDLYRPIDSIVPDVLIESITDLDNKQNLQKICKIIDPRFVPDDLTSRITAAKLLQKNKFFQEIILILQNPHTIREISNEIIKKDEFAHLFKSNADIRTLIWNYLKLGTQLPNPDIPNRFIPLIRVNVHNFFKSMESIFCCINCHKLFSIQRDNCDECKSIVEELGVCRFCGRQFFIAFAEKDAILSFINFEEEDGFLKLIGKSSSRKVLKCSNRRVEKDSSEQEIWETEEKVSEEFPIMKKCLKCGSYSSEAEKVCQNQQSNGTLCCSSDFKEVYLLVKKSDGKQGLQAKSPPHHCPFCQNSYGPSSALSKTYMSPNTASGTLFDLVYEELPDELRKMLIFTDNRQSASHFSGQLEMDHLTHSIRSLLYTIVKETSHELRYGDLKDEAFYRINAWYDGDMEQYDVKKKDVETTIDEELTSVAAKQRSLENLGLLQVNYRGMRNITDFQNLLSKQKFDQSFSFELTSEGSIEVYRLYLISILNILRTAGAFSTLAVRKYPDDQPVGFYMSSDSEGFSRPEKIKIMNILDGKPLQFTTKVFNIDKVTAKNILKLSFDFLKKNYLIISKDLQYGNYKPARGYSVVNESTTYIGMPSDVYKCDKCLKIFSNIPNSKCISWRCDGQTRKIDTVSFASENEQYYYQKYSNTDPIRMVTEEDTGALDINKRRSIEINFKETDPQKRKIDVIVATPTLELGVDIGDLHCVGLYRTPPNPISYFQRVGRAGRTTGLSLNNTFVFQNSIDNYYYRNPSEMIKGEMRPPYINLYNRHMIQRHANAIIIEYLFVYSKKRDQYPPLMSNFVKNSALEKMRDEINENRNDIFSRIRLAFDDLSMLEFRDKDIENMIQIFENSMIKSVEKYNEDLTRYQKRKEKLEMIHEKDYDVNKMKQRSYLDIGDQIWRLQHSDVLNHLMDTGVLPRYAFPGLYVDLEDEFGRVTFSGRSRNIAITEYAPGMEIYAMKRIYRSSGVDIKFTKPHEQIFYICQGCNKFVSKEPFDICNICSQSTKLTKLNAISPDIIYLRDTQKRVTESREYQEANLDIFLSTEKVRSKKTFDNLELSNFGNIDIVQLVPSIITSDTATPIQIQLCSLCGRARDENNQEKHRVIGGREYCKGEYQPLAIYHEMPTNVISVKITGDTLFGVKIEMATHIMRKIFLVTLKNAIINAAQLIAQAEEGEIDGVVKDDELIIYDNVEGGVGYVDVIYDKFDLIIDKAAEMILEESKVFGEECQHGCPKCLWSYRRKRDILNIDKQIILPLLPAAREYIRLQNTSSQIMQNQPGDKDTNIETIYSPSYQYNGLLTLRNKLRSGSKMIKLTSMYVTDDKIIWPDEQEKSWVDILCNIKKENPNITITITIREPHNIPHKLSLMRLKEWGIKILVYKNEAEQRFKDGIVHSKLVVIDPLEKDHRYAIHMSGNLSAEMEKNHETFHMSNSENWVLNTYNEIIKIENASRELTQSDLLFAVGQKRINIKPGEDLTSIIKEIGIDIGNTQKYISIMDPYLGKIDKLFDYLGSWLRKDVQIRIITSKIDSKEVKKVKEQYGKEGYNIKILRYFDRDRISGRETILHDRYIILDEKKAILLGKGVNTFLEDSKVSKDNVTVEILEIPSEVKIYVEDFREFWDYRSSHNSVIKSFPKDEI